MEDRARHESRIAKNVESSSHSRNWGSRQDCEGGGMILTLMELVYKALLLVVSLHHWKHSHPRQVGDIPKDVRVLFVAQKMRIVLLCRNAGKLNL